MFGSWRIWDSKQQTVNCEDAKERLREGHQGIEDLDHISYSKEGRDLCVCFTEIGRKMCWGSKKKAKHGLVNGQFFIQKYILEKSLALSNFNLIDQMLASGN